ncbi:hypothetical protein KIN20_024839 [Parelaphostrongylus tenuis]|uniref:Uncharacterized protein n=1 Tax=Parelaphostrongylus tenuis TaxID=148309 RepID=A0AAD5MU37_PARTN|nr:hypothetical protein KIN20_024839 [Parelaphostrongylus tenuis]
MKLAMKEVDESFFELVVVIKFPLPKLLLQGVEETIKQTQGYTVDVVLWSSSVLQNVASRLYKGRSSVILEKGVTKSFSDAVRSHYCGQPPELLSIDVGTIVCLLSRTSQNSMPSESQKTERFLVNCYRGQSMVGVSIDTSLCGSPIHSDGDQ